MLNLCGLLDILGEFLKWCICSIFNHKDFYCCEVGNITNVLVGWILSCENDYINDYIMIGE